MTSSSDRLVAVAEVARPHGVTGELRLKVYNPESSLFGRGRAVVLEQGETRTERTIQASRPTEGALLVRLSGIDDRNAAEALRGARVFVRRSAFPDLEDGEFYACDVEGARAELEDGELVGTVRELRNYPSVAVLVVETSSGESLEFPLVEAFVASIDTSEGVVRLKTREGIG